MPSVRSQLIDEIRSLAKKESRFTDMAVQIRVWRRGPGDKPVPAELLPEIYGGRWDAWRGAYSGTPEHIVELKAHPGQLNLLTFQQTGILRVLALGAPGGGKTMAVATRAVIEAIRAPYRTIGVVAPVEKRLKYIWKKLEQLLDPTGWVLSKNRKDNEWRLVNGSTFQFVSAKRASQQTGYAIAGADWDCAVEDEHQNMESEACEETEFRGRVAGENYTIYASATNQLITSFQDRLATYRNSKEYKVITYSGYDNCFTPLSWWDGWKARKSPEDFLRMIEGGDPPSDGRVYPRYDDRLSLAPIPRVGRDATQRLTKERYGSSGRDELGLETNYKYVVGVDWGLRTFAAVVMQAFEGDNPSERIWYAVGELTVEQAGGTDKAATELLTHMRSKFHVGPSGFIVIGDPHYTTHPTEGGDKSDYHVFRRHGMATYKASPGNISRHHRYGMVNALLHAEDGKRRLLLAVDDHGSPLTPSLIRSFRNYRNDADLEGSNQRRNHELSHWTDALGYGLFPFERIRGSDTATVVSPSAPAPIKKVA